MPLHSKPGRNAQQDVQPSEVAVRLPVALAIEIRKREFEKLTFEGQGGMKQPLAMSTRPVMT
jgi:hypothetical protein